MPVLVRLGVQGAVGERDSAHWVGWQARGSEEQWAGAGALASVVGTTRARPLRPFPWVLAAALRAMAPVVEWTAVSPAVGRRGSDEHRVAALMRPGRRNPGVRHAGVSGCGALSSSEAFQGRHLNEHC